MPWYSPLVRLFRAAIAIGIAAALITSIASADDWRTRERALICPNPSVIKEAQRASDTGNISWFKETGCVAAVAGLPVVIIDNTGRDAWYGRIMGPAGEASLWFPPYSIVNVRPDAAPRATFDGLLKTLTKEQVALPP